jgi:hypothetical protein
MFEEEPELGGTIGDVLNGVRGSFSSWGLREINYDPGRADHLDQVLTKPSTSSGWGEDRMQGDRMGASAAQQWEATRQRLKEVRESVHADVTPWVIGGRAKRTTIEPGKVLKGRAIVYPGAQSRLIGGLFSQPITRAFAHSTGGIWVGKKMGEESLRELAIKAGKYLFQRGVDWRRCGFRLPEILVVAALGCAYAMYPDTPEVLRAFLHIAAGTVAKTVILPGGWVYKCMRGSPSGPFTSIIDTFANLMIFGSAYARLGVPRTPPLEVYGDDSMEHCGDSRYRPYRAVRDICRYLWDMVGDEEAEIGTFFQVDESTPYCTFLKRYVYYGTPTRPLSAWLDVSILPEKKRNSYIAQLGRMVYLNNEPTPDPAVRKYFTNFFGWVGDKLRVPRRVTDWMYTKYQSMAGSQFYRQGGGVSLQPNREGKRTLGELREIQRRLTRFRWERAPPEEAGRVWRAWAWRTGHHPFWIGFRSWAGSAIDGEVWQALREVRDVHRRMVDAQVAHIGFRYARLREAGGRRGGNHARLRPQVRTPYW